MSMSETASSASLREIAETSTAWPFEEAKKILARLKRKPKDEVIFETGYGPSGLPHIGTFGEVARTTMVRHAFEFSASSRKESAVDIGFSGRAENRNRTPRGQ